MRGLFINGGNGNVASVENTTSTLYLVHQSGRSTGVFTVPSNGNYAQEILTQYSSGSGSTSIVGGQLGGQIIRFRPINTNLTIPSWNGLTIKIENEAVGTVDTLVGVRVKEAPSVGLTKNLRWPLFLEDTIGVSTIRGAVNVGSGAFTRRAGVINAQHEFRLNNVNIENIYAKIGGNTGIVTIGSNDSTTVIESGGTAQITITDAGVISTPSGTIPSVLSNSATLDFIDTPPGECSNLTITVTGAADGDEVALGVPTGSMPANGSFFAYVSGANTVTVRYCNNQLAGNLNPASGTFKVKVIK